MNGNNNSYYIYSSLYLRKVKILTGGVFFSNIAHSFFKMKYDTNIMHDSMIFINSMNSIIT